MTIFSRPLRAVMERSPWADKLRNLGLFGEQPIISLEQYIDPVPGARCLY